MDSFLSLLTHSKGVKINANVLRELKWDEVASNGTGHSIYRKGGIIVNNYICDLADFEEGESISDFMCSTFSPQDLDCENWHEVGANYGLKLEFEKNDVAKEGEECVRVWVEKNVYGSKRSGDFHRDYEGNIVVFSTYAEAQEFIKNYDDEVYYCSHNEAGRPDLEILS